MCLYFLSLYGTFTIVHRWGSGERRVDCERLEGESDVSNHSKRHEVEEYYGKLVASIVIVVLVGIRPVLYHYIV